MWRQLLLAALAACTGSAPNTDATDIDSEPDTDPPWAPPEGGPFQFQTTTTWKDGQPWTVDAHCFPASKKGRPAVLLFPGMSGWSADICGIDDWPEGLVEPFVERDWAVIITDRVGCRTTHPGYVDPYEIEQHHLPDDLMVQLTRKLRADGYGPLTVVSGWSGLYWVRARDADVPQMKAGVLPGSTPRTGTSYPMSHSVPLEWLFISPFESEEDYRELREEQWQFMGAPQDAWTWRWGVSARSFTAMKEGDGTRHGLPPHPEIFEEIAQWLEPRLEEAYEAGPEAWETP